MEEKKKQAEEFYKSDSDGEDTDDDLDWTPEQKDKAAVTEGKPVLTVTSEKNDEQIRTEKQLSFCTDTEEKDKSVETEEEESLCAATDLISNDILPDLNAVPTESSTQNMDPQDSCSGSLLVTSQAVISLEDEGIGTFEKNTENDPSTSLHMIPPGDIADKQRCEDTSSMIDSVNGKTETLQNEAIKKDINTKSLSDEEETFTSEHSINKDDQESNEVDNADKDELKTPKVNLLKSKLPEEELKKIMSVTPRLSFGKEGDFIDLEETSTPSQDPGMAELINRFLRHSNIKRKPAEKREVNLK